MINSTIDTSARVPSRALILLALIVALARDFAPRAARGRGRAARRAGLARFDRSGPTAPWLWPVPGSGRSPTEPDEFLE